MRAGAVRARFRAGVTGGSAGLGAARAVLVPGVALDFHSLRRSHITHLIEAGWDPLFVQQQAGHAHASTTSLYTCVSSDFRTRTLRRVLDETVSAALGAGQGPEG